MIILDTHTLLWWVDGNSKLSENAEKAILNEINNDGLIQISVISIWEIALLVSKGRLTLTMNIDDWVKKISEIDCVNIVPLDSEVVLNSTRLPDEFHPDPADRFITALARKHSSALITADNKILKYKHVKTIW